MDRPLMRPFVRLAGSGNQIPLPAVRQGNLVKRKLESLGNILMTTPAPPELEELAETIENEINVAIESAAGR